MESKRQTAVEWYIEQVDKLEEEYGYPDIDKLFWLKEDALQMEREQIQDAWISAWQDSMLEPLDRRFYEDLAEEYYTETYGKE